MSAFGQKKPVKEGPLWSGLLRILLAATVAALLTGVTPPASPVAAYLATGLTLAFGTLLVVGGSSYPAREPLVRVVADSFLVGLLTAATGGAESPYFLLYPLAAVGILGVRGGARPMIAAAAVLAAFGGSVAASGGVEALASGPVGLRAALVALFCVVAWRLGSGMGELAGHNGEISASRDAWRGRAEGAERLVTRFGPTLRNASLEEILRWTVEAAHAAGGTYAHVASLQGTNHRTIMKGEADACPSWFHPSIQRLVLRSCRDGEATRSDEDIHGAKNFLAVPVGPAGGERWGAVVLGGGRFGAAEERLLGLVSATAAAALEGIEDAPGGRDPATGLPNRVSLHRILQQELSRGRPLTVLAVDPGGVRHRETVGRIGDRLVRWRVSRYDEDVFVLVLSGADDTKARRVAFAARQIVSEETAGVARTAVGFAFSGIREGRPATVLDAALGALGEARRHPDGVVGGAEVGPRTGGVVESMVGALEAKDPDIREHLEGVRHLALRIGRRMALPDGQIEALDVGALLHDVGKIGIPDRILHKPGRLTAEEYETMKRHPMLGVEIIGLSSALAPALPIVKHHHERFDGKGYPDGLCGESIPLLARIVSVADAFDSMIRDRPYGYGVGPNAALQEVRDNSGTQFDPRLVNVLLSIFEDGSTERRADSAG